MRRPSGGGSKRPIGGGLKLHGLGPPACAAAQRLLGALPRCGGPAAARKLHGSGPLRFRPSRGAAAQPRRLENSTVQAAASGGDSKIHGSGPRRLKPSRGAAGKGRRLEDSTLQARGGSSPPAVRRARGGDSKAPQFRRPAAFQRGAAVQALPRCGGRGAAARKVHSSGPRRFKPARGVAASGGDSKTPRFRIEVVRSRPQCGGQRRRFEKSTVRLREKQSSTLVPWIQRVEGGGWSTEKGTRDESRNKNSLQDTTARRRRLPGSTTSSKAEIRRGTLP